MVVSFAVASVAIPSAFASSPARSIAAPAGFGIQLLSTAAETLENPLARTYIADGLAPGAAIARTLEISNTTRSTAVVSVYAAAASFDHSNFAFAPGRSQNGLSRWTTIGEGVLRVPPRSTAFDIVTIHVPKQASAGEQYAVIWAQMSAAPKTRGGVKLVNRVGVRMYVSIGDGGLPAADFVVGSLSAHRSTRGQPFLLARIHNSGQQTLAITGDLTLSSGPGGLRAGPYPVRLETALAPGDSESLTVTLNKILPSGPWRAEIRLGSGVLQRIRDDTIRFPQR